MERVEIELIQQLKNTQVRGYTATPLTGRGYSFLYPLGLHVSRPDLDLNSHPLILSLPQMLQKAALDELESALRFDT